MQLRLIIAGCTLFLLLGCGDDSNNRDHSAQREEAPQAGVVECHTTIDRLPIAEIRTNQDQSSYYDCTDDCELKTSLIRFTDVSGDELKSCLGTDQRTRSFRLCSGDAIETEDFPELGTQVYIRGSERGNEFELWCDETILDLLYIH